MTSEISPILRCFDVMSALHSVAALFGVTPAHLATVLPSAAASAFATVDAPDPANLIVPSVAAAVGRQPITPGRIHYFHGTRSFDPTQFKRSGLLPLSSVLDDLWRRVQSLAPEIEPCRFAQLREAVEDGRIDALTYKAREDIGRRDDGPDGVLVRDVLLKPHAYSSSAFLRIPETVENILVAACNELRVELRPRYEKATTPCIVEFTAPPERADRALGAACWYVESALRGEITLNAFCNFSGDGRPVPPENIVSVDIQVKPE